MGLQDRLSCGSDCRDKLLAGDGVLKTNFMLIDTLCYLLQKIVKPFLKWRCE